MMFQLSFVYNVNLVNAGSLWDKQTGMNQEEIGKPFGDNEPEDVRIIVARYINFFLGFLGIIFLGLILYAGFLWMTDAGGGKNIEKAKGIISASVIGLIIILMAYGITELVTNSLNEVTNG